MSGAAKVAVEVAGRTLTLSNLSKVLYPAAGFTKGEMIAYYLRIAPVLLPHIAGRPVTFKRYPDGVDGKFFYAKHAPAHRPDWVPTAPVASEEGGEPVRYVVADDLPTLIWAANLAGLEIHTPMWRLPDIGRPDLLVFDLDPGPPANIVDCARVALLLRPLLAELDLRALPKTSGSKGLQVYAEVADMTSEQTRGIAHAVAQRLERDRPELVVSRMTKRLRADKVLIDWSQNNTAKTTVAPYSLRAMARPTVSTPLTWQEVEACRRPKDLAFTAVDVLTRVDEFGDLFAPLLPQATT
ncbi:MAG: non-homologous end-joining DNA ligase [Sciscionella sp.]